MASRTADVLRGTLYLLVSFPLGVAYFVFVVVGVSLGVSLLILVVGIFVLAGTASVARRLAVADARFAAWLFDTSEPSLDIRPGHGGLFETSLVELTSLASYRALAYLLARFVVGVGGFVVVVTWLALSGTLLATPLLYDNPEFIVSIAGVHTVEALPVALALAGVGAVVAVVGAVVVAAIGRAAARGSTLLLTFPRSVETGSDADSATPESASEEGVDDDERAVTDGERQRE